MPLLGRPRLLHPRLLLSSGLQLSYQAAHAVCNLPPLLHQLLSHYARGRARLQRRGRRRQQQHARPAWLQALQRRPRAPLLPLPLLLGLLLAAWRWRCCSSRC